MVIGTRLVDVKKVIQPFYNPFSLKDHGELLYFLGMEATQTQECLDLTQTKYISDLLFCAKMVNVKLVSTPMSFTVLLEELQGVALMDPTSYQATIGSLQYVALTRFDISFAVNRLSQFKHDPTTIYKETVKLVLRNLAGTVTKGFFSPRGHFSIFKPSLIRIGLVTRMSTNALLHILSTLVD